MPSNRKRQAKKNEAADWQRYERLVATLIAEQLSTAYCVTPNAKVNGKITHQNRQIDVLIDLRHETDNRQRIIVDAKARKRPIDVTHVEAFQGLMSDVGATHGYLVCANGFSEAALRRAQESVSIRLLPLDRLENFDPSTWPKCLSPNRRAGRIFWDGFPAFDLRVAPAAPSANPTRSLTFVHYVGKCDRCASFHVKCMSCGDIFSPPYDDEHDEGIRCKCQNPWFWLASIEQAQDGGKSAELHFVSILGTVWTVDRRSL